MSTSSTIVAGGIIAIIALLILFFTILFVVAWYVISSIAEMKLFKKMGEEGWKAWIPFYNQWTLIKTIGLDWYWFLLLNASIVSSIMVNIANYSDGASIILSLISIPISLCSIVANVAIAWNLAAKFKKDTSFIVLYSIFSGIMMLVIGFNKDIPDMIIPVEKDAFMKKLFNK